MKNREYHPSIFIVLTAFLMQVLVMILWKDHSFVAIHDNLDLFVAHNKMMKDQELFFTKDGVAPMLGGVSRNLLGSEFFLFNFLFFLFPPYTAYVINYFLKIGFGFFGGIILARECLGKEYKKYQFFLWPIAAAYGMIPVFPAYGICFTSLPILVFLLLRIMRTGRRRYYLGLFCYPVISYFSYFGFFILAYLTLAFLILWWKNRKFPIQSFLCILILSLGYVCFEYRLFSEMLFSDTITIREEIEVGSLNFQEIIREIMGVIAEPGFHSQDSHKYFILPVIMLIILVDIIRKVKCKTIKKIGKDPLYLIFGGILMNCLIYGLYRWMTFRIIIERWIPKLKGFQFNRTIFLNPFLWYLLFFLCVKRMKDILGEKKRGDTVLEGAAVLSLIIVMFTPQVYNDFYNNCYHHGYEILTKKSSSQLSFREFYAEDFFEKIKDEIDYKGEWSVAYGMHPAVLQYNKIATLDGYLGIYSKEYKDKFYRLIAPALEKSEEFYLTFKYSGIRAYLFSGSGENTYLPVKELKLKDHNLYMDTNVFRDMGGKYIFSRIKIDNAKELELKLINIFREPSYDYEIYVYELRNRPSFS